jgi:hypothetical protein
MYFANGHKSVSICTLFGFPIQIGLLERVAGEADSEPHLRMSVSRSSRLSFLQRKPGPTADSGRRWISGSYSPIRLGTIVYDGTG